MDRPARPRITGLDRFRFRVRLDEAGMPDVITDEPAPLEGGQGPNPVTVVA